MQEVQSHAQEQTTYIDMEHAIKQTGIQKNMYVYNYEYI